MSVDSLQKTFKILSDPTRVRILTLLEREELAVQELMDVLGMAQSRVSRHLAILRGEGLLRDRRDGTYVHYRFPTPLQGLWQQTWEIVRRETQADPTTERDRAALARVLEARASRTRSWFDRVGPEWDGLRKVFDDDVLRARAISRLAPRGLTVCDVGTGTGILALELAQLGMQVIAIDNSPAMIGAARAKLEDQGIEGVELRQGDAADLPLDDDSIDGAFAHMVLHYLPSPAEALAEMARVVKPGGSVVVVDFVQHEREWMRDELGVLWLGFPLEDVRSWFERAGLGELGIQRFERATSGGDLPATFIASARCP